MHACASVFDPRDAAGLFFPSPQASDFWLKESRYVVPVELYLELHH